MEEPSLTTLERSHDAAIKSAAMSERLEFGKFCVTPDGPIETNRDRIPIEHSQLGWSGGFPQELIPSCHPTSLGISREGSEPLPDEREHGTVLRPVVRHNQIRSVFYSVRSRPEDGEEQTGRRYTLARYLVAPTEDASPLAMLFAMNSVPLRGMTRRDSREISPIALTEQEVPTNDVSEAFLREARIYVLSGVPISITDKIPEKEFFTLVSLLHESLPAILRPHLSAGWNVGSSYSGHLGVTYTIHRAANAALFSPHNLNWSSPECMTTWNAQRQPVVSSYDPSRLEPGRLFQEYISLEAESRDLDDSLPGERSSILMDSLPSIDLPEFPDWHDASAVRVLRYPGLQARDQFAIAALSRWLIHNDENPRLYRDARRLSYRANRMKALDLILQALAEPASRGRADEALWLSVSDHAPSSFTIRINGARGTGAPRARLITAIGDGNVSETIRAFQLAVDDEREDLPNQALAGLTRIFDESLSEANRNLLPFHIELLVSPPSHYREWVKRRALELMRALASQEGTPQAAYESIATISDSDEARALLEFIKGVKPTPALTGFLHTLATAARGIFLELFNQSWGRKGEGTAERREDLLGWFHSLNPEEPVNPLLRLESGKRLEDSEVSAVGDDVEHRRVPPSLLPSVAVLALERWSVLGRRVLTRPREWCELTRLWPTDHARILGGIEGQRSPSQRILRAATDLRLSFADITEILNARITRADFSTDAPVLWKWATSLEKRLMAQVTALDLCVYLSAGELPPGKLATNSELQLFADFARVSNGLKLSSDTLQRLWAESTERWQMELFLFLFPMEDFQPSAYQLGLWVTAQDWLIRHLDRSHVHGHRRNRFYVATRPFQSLSYLDDGIHWQEGFIKTGIWAAFQRVPVAILPTSALRRALRAYTSSEWTIPTAEQSPDLIDQQARMCLSFIKGYVGRDGQGSASLDPALRMVLLDFLLSALHCNDYDAAIDVFVDIEARSPRSRSKRKPQYSFSSAMTALLEEVYMLSDSKLLQNVIDAYYKESRRS